MLAKKKKNIVDRSLHFVLLRAEIISLLPDLHNSWPEYLSHLVTVILAG